MGHKTLFAALCVAYSSWGLDEKVAIISDTIAYVGEKYGIIDVIE